jgi:hypothetical protein
MSGAVRFWLITCTALSAASFGWAAVVLPWRPGTPLALLAGALAVLHAATALSAVCWSEGLRKIWRVLAFGSLLGGATFSIAIGWASVTLVRTYGDLGWGLAALLGVIGLLLVFCTLPMGLWGLMMTGKAHGRH